MFVGPNVSVVAGLEGDKILRLRFENIRRISMGNGVIGSTLVVQNVADSIGSSNSLLASDDDLDSPLILSYEQDFSFNVKSRYGLSIRKKINFDKVPVSVIHDILLCVPPPNMVNYFCTCKLFLEVGSHNGFWRTYYENYFNMKIGDCSSTLNWKEVFYKRFRKAKLPEYLFLKEFKFSFDKTVGSILDNFTFGICGRAEIGTQEFLQGFQGLPYTENKYQRQVIFQIREKACKKIGKGTSHCQLFYYPNHDKVETCDGYLLCFDVCQLRTFTYLRTCLEKIRIVSKEIRIEESQGNRTNIVVVGFNAGVKFESRNVDRKTVVDFVKQNRLKGYVEMSVKDGYNVYHPAIVLFKRILKQRDEDEELARACGYM